MKLVTFGHRGFQRVGLLERERVIDVNRAYAALLAQRGDPRAGAMADALVPEHGRYLSGWRTSVGGHP